jgi:N-methylhydantoinase A
MRAVRALESGVGGALRLPVEEVAWGVHRLANATMARALRAVSTERGLDPRGFALMAFGGNGPVHAATLAQALEIGRILVPPVPGVFSSLGMLFPEVEHHYVRTQKRPLGSGDLTWMRAAFEQLASEGAEALAAEGFAAAAQAFDAFADLRYSAANSELTVPVSLHQSAGELRLFFEDAHEQQYGYRSPGVLGFQRLQAAQSTNNQRRGSRLGGITLAGASRRRTAFPDELCLDEVNASRAPG